jgi:hypothetical protein
MRRLLVSALVLPAALGLVVAFADAGTQDGKVTIRIVGANNGQDVTNGGVSGHGRFTVKGALSDAGTVVAYRRVVGNLNTGHATITLRFVTKGKKGTITYKVTVVVRPTTTTSTWKIVAGTKAYAGLYGHGVESENADHSVATLTGTVARPRRPNA